MDFDITLPASPKQAVFDTMLLLLVILGGFAVARVLGAVTGVLLTSLSITLPQEFRLPFSTILSGTAFVAVSLGYLYFNNSSNPLNVSLPSGDDIGWALLGFLGVFVVAIFLGGVVEFFGIETATNEVQEIGAETPVTFLYMIPLAFLVVGVSEELLFRGIVQRKLVSHLGVGGGIVAASALFGIAHLAALQGAGLSGILITMTILSALGLVMGITYEKTDNLTVPILIHGAYDAVLFAASYLVSSGVIEGGVLFGVL